MSRQFIEETIERINRLMADNGDAKTYADVSFEDNRESMELVGRISDIADAAEKYRSKHLPEGQRAVYAFAKTLTETDIALFKNYFIWFRGLKAKGGK